MRGNEKKKRLKKGFMTYFANYK